MIARPEHAVKLLIVPGGCRKRRQGNRRKFMKIIKKEDMYRGVVTDRLGSLPSRKTRFYGLYKEAYEAAERLARRYGERAKITIE